jgi:ERCC4-type nuclease
MLIVDHRERDLIKALEDVGVCHETHALDVGDMCFQRGKAKGEKETSSDDDETTTALSILVERKTMTDMAASIKDGRYAEQKQRLSAYRKTTRGAIVVLLIEGKTYYDDHRGDSVAGIPRKSLVSTVLNARFRDGFFVVETRDLAETVSFVRCMVDRLPTATRWGPSCSSSFSSDFGGGSGGGGDYVPCVVKTVKRENMDVAKSFLCQLCQIPGVSLKTAEVISKATSSRSMGELIKSVTARWPSRDAIGEKTMETVAAYIGVVKPPVGRPIREFFPMVPALE